MRGISRLLFLTVLLTWASAALAVEYTFTKIADNTSGRLAGHGLGNATINATGTVAFQASAPSSSGIFIGNGGPITTIADEISLFISGLGVPVINDNGVVAFIGFLGAGGDVGIFTGSGGPITTIVDTTGPFSFGQFPAINNSGTVAFTALHETLGPGVFTGSGGPITTIVDESGDFTAIRGNPAINNLGTVAFFANRLGVQGVFATSGGDPITIADTSGPFVGFGGGKISINDDGTVAFGGDLSFANQAIGFGNGGSPTILTDTLGPFLNFDLFPSINSANTVMFEAFLDAGGSGIFTGPDPVGDKVIQTGDPLLGSTVAIIDFISGGLNDNGQIAFSAQLADGTKVIVRADPVVEFTIYAVDRSTDELITLTPNPVVSGGELLERTS